MASIAVAGGTRSVGRTIVEALVAANKHNVIVLTRSVGDQKAPMALVLTYV